MISFDVNIPDLPTIGDIKNKLFSDDEEVIPWDNWRDHIYKHVERPYKVFEITPTTGVRNNQAYVLAKVFASFYRSPRELRDWFNGRLLTTKSPFRCNFRIIMKADSVGFYLLVPEEKSKQVMRKVEGVYDNGITIKEVEQLPSLNPNKTFCTELHYRKHDIFSLDTDRRNNNPLPSLLTAVRSLEGEDIAIFDAMFEPYNRVKWMEESKKANDLLDQGYKPDKNFTATIARHVHQALEIVLDEIADLFHFTKEQKREYKKYKRERKRNNEAGILKREMTNASKRKQDSDVLKTYLRIAVESNDKERAKDAAYTLASSWKDISEDNELDRNDIYENDAPGYLERLEDRKPSTRHFKSLKLSTEEAGKFLQLPGRELIEEFPGIKSQKIKEVEVSDELTRTDIKKIRIGTATKRGENYSIGIPLEKYEGVRLKDVYDALCMPVFTFGNKSTGKTEGFGTVNAHDMVMAGFTAIIIDTADGDMLNKFLNSLPKDYPDRKIHAIDVDNKEFPPQLGWDDIFGRNLSDDAELETLEISQRLTNKFIEFINSLSETGEFTDQMEQIVKSCMRAISIKDSWSFLDLELCLTSPSYREELLSNDELKRYPDVINDLQMLQGKSISSGSDRLVSSIMSRIKKLSGNPFLEHMFFQKPKLDQDNNPILDFRKIMDNEDGGYGHVICINATYNSWQQDQATILSFLFDKINFNVFSRVDIPQSERKPCLIWIDEPHKVIGLLEDQIKGPLVEYRKYRARLLLTAHHLGQMGKAGDDILASGAQITSYKTKNINQFKKVGHVFSPYEPEELYYSLPEKYTAVNSITLPSGKNSPAIIAEMTKPPSHVVDRSYIWDKCSKKYGCHWRKVKDNIQGEKSKYSKLDQEWRDRKQEEAMQKKAMEKAKKSLADNEAKKELGLK